MKFNFQQHILDVMSGTNSGLAASSLRCILRAAEPLYASIVRGRNRLFDLGWKKTRRLDRSVVSIGNMTTGGTGKTPVVCWLAEKLRSEGKAVAILSRGYRARYKALGDELTMLERALNRPEAPRVFVQGNPDRIVAGEALLHDHPEIDLFVLDDGFQHRRVRRDLDLLLVSALQPFGFGHVLPRGLLREPLRGIRRADAVLITHADRVGGAAVEQIEAVIRKYNPTAPIYRAVHAESGLLTSEGPAGVRPMQQLSVQRFFAFSGIGSPSSFEGPLERFGANFVGRRRLADHHDYSATDLNQISSEARNLGAEVLVTTEKDWVKLEHLTCQMPIYRVDVRVQFRGNDEERLLAQIRQALASRTKTSLKQAE